MTLSSLGLACALLAVVDAFDIAPVPAGGLFGVATWLLLAAGSASVWTDPQGREYNVSRGT